MLAALVRFGAVDSAAACDREVTLRDASRSNPVFVVSVDGQDRYVVKQEGPSVDGGSSAEAEISAYRWLATERDLAGVAPRARSLGADNDWLVLDVDPDAFPLHELMTMPGTDLAAAVAGVARLLRRLHTVSARTRRAESVLPVRRPWSLELASGTTPDFAAENPAAGAVVAGVRADTRLMSLVRDAAETWSPSAAIHGDIKWDNILIRRGQGAERGPVLIDWELAAWGDPLWDLAGLVEGLLTTSVIAAETPDLEPAVALGRTAVGAYGLATTAAQPLVRFVAVRLVQTTVQLAGMGELVDPPAPGSRLLELAVTLAGNPAAWAAELCGTEDGT